MIKNMDKEWTEQEKQSWEIGMKIGDMHGEWERSETKTNRVKERRIPKTKHDKTPEKKNI